MSPVRSMSNWSMAKRPSGAFGGWVLQCDRILFSPRVSWNSPVPISRVAVDIRPAIGGLTRGDVASV